MTLSKWQRFGVSTRVFIACASALSLAAGPGAAAAPSGSYGVQWVETWAVSPQQPDDPLVGPTNPTVLSDQTTREVARISTGGNLIRLRLTNEYTDAQTFIGSVHVALSKATKGMPTSDIVLGTDHVVTFGGQNTIILAPNAPAISDPIDFPVNSLSSLAVSIYVTRATQPTTGHTLGTQTAYLLHGNDTSLSGFGSAATTTVARYLLSGIDVTVAKPSGTIVTLGDSITDGYHSTTDGNARWPDDLAVRLRAAGMGDLAVANEGISGNRVRLQGVGPNAQSRFDRDVLARPGARYVTVLEGINDIGIPVTFPDAGPEPTPGDIVQAYQQLILRAHEYGIRIFGGTLTPYQGASYASAKGEQTRTAVNDWIRTSGQFDGVIDFDAAVRDPAHPLRILPAYDSGDHLHPNDAGYAAMAESIDLRLFRMSPYLVPATAGR